MALHEHNTHGEIGEAIVGPPENPDVAGWREFLKRPENLATALVLLAGVTGPRQRGQTKLNKALTGGVGALAFRGGLEQGVEAQRATGREEERTIAQQQAEITAGRAATAQGAQQTRTLQQQVEQQGQARPLAQSEIELNEAQAAALGRDPDAVPNDFASLFAKNQEDFAESNPGVEANLGELALKTTKQLLIIQLADEGKITGAGFDVTPEEAAILGIELPELEEEDGDPETKPSKEIEKSLRISGILGSNKVGQQATVRVLRKEAEFADLSDDAILDRLADIRRLAQDRGALEKLQLEELRDMLTVFGRVLARKEIATLRSVIGRKSGVSAARLERIGGVGTF